MTEGSRHTVLGGGVRLEGACRVPGDKSISHRAVLLGSVGHGEMAVQGLSSARDVLSSIEAVEALGIKVRPRSKVLPNQTSSRDLEFDWECVVVGRGWDALSSPSSTLDVGNSGTTLRVLLGVLAGSQVRATLTGDASIQRRPMGRVTVPLRRMGADIVGAAGGEHAPLTVTGRQLTGVHHRLEVASAQVKSALLLAGLRASGETSVQEPAPSRDHTERMLKYLGVQVAEDAGRLSVKSTNILNSSVTVPGDFSSAAFLLAAAAILPESRLLIEEVGLNPTRTTFIEVLREFGAEISIRDLREECGEPRGTLEIRSGDRRPVSVEVDRVPAAVDELPLVAVLSAFAEGTTEVRGAAELRVKESDRIAAIVDGLSKMGAAIEPLPDGFVVQGGARLNGARVSSHGDHRIAMALAVAALGAVGETTIEGWDAVAISYPGFEKALEQVLVP